MITINSILNFADLKNAEKIIDNTCENQKKSITFVKIDDFHVFADDGSVYQIVDELPEKVILAYEVEEGVYLNYAEEEIDFDNVKEFIENITPDFEELSEEDLTDVKDDFELINRCDAYDNDDVVTSHNKLINMFEERCNYFSSYANFYYFCGMKKRFNDFDTKFNPYNNNPDYTPHTIYYFF